MHLTPQHTISGKNRVTAWRAVFGNKRAQSLGLLDKDGNPIEFIPVSSSNGILLLPKTEKIQRFEHDSLSADVYRHNNIFFGEISSVQGSPSFWGTTIEKAQQSFSTLAENLIAL